jgi:hypothetical protein
METTRRSTVSPSGRSSAGSPASYTSSQGSPSLITSSLSTRTMTMPEAGSSWTDSIMLSERPSHMQSPPAQIAGPSVTPNQPPRIVAPIPFKAVNTSNYHDRTIPPLSSSHPFYPPDTPTNCSPTSDRSMESNMESTREIVMRRDHIREVAPRHLYPFPQNYSVNDPNVHPEGSLQMSSANASIHDQFHDCCTTQREWDTSDRVHGIRDQGLAGRRFVHPSDPTQPQHSLQPCDYSR